MIFSRIGRSLSRSSRTSYFLYGDDWRLRISSGASRTNETEGGLGLLRGYLSSSSAAIVPRSSNGGFTSVSANPRLLRLLCSYYKKQVPKGDDEKNASKDESDTNKDDHRNFKKTTFIEEFQKNSTTLALIALLLASLSFGIPSEQQQISFQEFKNKLLGQGLVDHIVVTNKPVAELEEAQEALGIGPHDHVPPTYFSLMLPNQQLLRFAPIIILLGTLLYMGRKASGFGAGGILNIGKAHVTKVDKIAKNKVYFKDVVGCDAAKQESMKLVDFLKNPKRYAESGAKIPKGALLYGRPGVGKTLLAKAIVGESGVPFFSISASYFMGEYVAPVPSRVRYVFEEARQCAPSIVYIDEINDIGREDALNTLCVEMDRLATTAGVVVLAKTNRPEMLERAARRRFDLRISMATPGFEDRDQIFQIYLKKMKLDHEPSYFSESLAALTQGYRLADIANVCNEAAIIAATGEKNTRVTLKDFHAAILNRLSKQSERIDNGDFRQ